MGRPRLEFQQVLENLVDEGGEVYFQPPATKIMTFPCIRYKPERLDGVNADNATYLIYDGYDVTYISRDPDSPVPKRLRMLPLCRFIRYYVTDNLHHWVFTIYY